MLEILLEQHFVYYNNFKYNQLYMMMCLFIFIILLIGQVVLKLSIK